ncbi:MAG: hypothetical protein II399_05645, partial [Lachnospiraceae bacterium]|nr:hypothetical protein [Lachnospiraceae bacterium]
MYDDESGGLLAFLVLTFVFEIYSKVIINFEILLLKRFQMISVDIERFKNRILEYGKNDYRQMSEEQAKYFANRLSQKLDACM